MKILRVLLVVCALYLGVMSQQAPVVVEVEGLLGKYGGYYLGAAVLLLAYYQAKNTDTGGTTFKINGETMTTSNGGGGGPTPIGR